MLPVLTHSFRLIFSHWLKMVDAKPYIGMFSLGKGKCFFNIMNSEKTFTNTYNNILNKKILIY